MPRRHEPARRRFIRRFTGLFATATGAAVLPGCGKEEGSAPDRATLEALLDTLIPADQDPGALQAGVLDAVIDRIQNDPVAATRYRRLLSYVGEQSLRLHERPFHRLAPLQKHELLSALYHSSGRELARQRVDLHVVLEHCFHAFYSSPAAERVIGYHPPIKGGYPGYGEPPEPVE